METDEDDKVLRLLADGEDMDYSLWPDLFSRLIPRLEKIVREDFPVPVVPRPQPMLAFSQPIPSSPPLPASQQPSLVTDTSSPNSVGESTNKENAPPEGVSTSTGSIDSLPPQIISLLNSITKTLQTLFSKYPPHTIQRLAELILHPRQHYKSLYNYLHAVDRVVHVTSGAHVFPLPPAVPDASAASVLSNGTSATDPLSISWGKPTSTAQSTLGSDESLGGALLTPILWLSNKNGNSHVSDIEGEVRTESTETIEGPNGPGGIETVSVSVNGISSATAATTTLSNSIDNGTTSLRAEGGVTQGELLRQEQRAGVVPAAQLANHGRGDADGVGEDDETPHARGPEEIGMEDMGPQSSGNGTERSGSGMTMQGIDVEAAVGRRAEDSESMEEDAKERPSTPKREADEELGSDEKRLKEDRTEELKEGEIKKEETKEVEMVDADGRAEDEKKVGESGENVGSDAIDTSAV